MAGENDDLDLEDLDPPQDQDDQDDQGQDDQGADDQGGEQGPDDQGGDDQIDARDSREQRQEPGESRGSRRQQTLANDNAELRRQVTELNRRLDAVVTQRNQPQGETPEQRNARRATMQPEERMYDVLNEHTEAWRGEQTRLQMQLADSTDKASFDARCAADKRWARRRDQVETTLQDLRSKGMNASRENVLYFLVGKNILEAADGKEVRRQRQEGAQRVRRETVRRGANSSDTRAERGRSTSLERRLENVPI